MINPNTFNKEEWVEKQTKEANDKGRPFVRCGCLKKLWMPEAYKCLYCKEWFCECCAEIHFDKTIKQYNLDKLNNQKVKLK